MGNNPSLFIRSPQELAYAHRETLQKHKGLLIRPVLPPPPPGYIRIHYYTGLDRIMQDLPPEIEANMPLDRDGGLRLQKVNDLWGLEECLPIDPMRWEIFESRFKGRLSPLAVKILSERQGCIQFIEKDPSRITLYKRSCRHTYITLVILATSRLQMIYNATLSLINTYTPLPRVCRDTAEQHKQLEWRRKRWAAEHEPFPWASAFHGIASICLITFIFAVMVGFVDLAIKQRVWQWARTGSICL
ncbi:hypothetical protein BD779DRAFT_1513669 [Infundibulicybe gibba]|nr:hypothetical protein BD779DRAFT_1513669 [Infundibulicybe gibba]